MQITGLSNAYMQGGNGTCNQQLQRPRHPWHTGARVQHNPAPVSVLMGSSSDWFNPVQSFFFTGPLFFFHLCPGPAIPQLQLRRECSDSASVRVKCFYCSCASLTLTSSCSALASLQKRVPWDPSAPLLDGISDTSGKQKWINSSCVYKCIWKMSIAGWSCATNPHWQAGNICPAKKKKNKIKWLWRCHRRNYLQQ